MLILMLASIGQMYAKDFHFMAAQEAWAADQQPRDAGYQWFIPPAVNDRIEMWRSDSVVDQKIAVRELVAMGREVARPMFRILRARDRNVQHLGRIVLARLRTCTICKGSGLCPGFEGDKVPTGTCKWCDCLKYTHDNDLTTKECRTCEGRGYDMRIPGDFKP